MAPSSERRTAQLEKHIAPQACASYANPVGQKPATVQAMQDERDRANFEVQKLTYVLEGGKKAADQKQKMMLELERDVTFRMYDIHDLTKDELRYRTMEKFHNILHHLSNESVAIFKQRLAIVSLIDPGFWTRFGVHFGLFFGALQGSATSGQFAYWASKGAVSLNGMIGCFAMTELGHGSNVAALETTATFDAAADQFIIHTPTITATKWWIGGAAHTATHAVVFAQLIVNGKKYGVKSFVVPLRDPKTYTLLPGINIGDIGKKMGRDGIDNGWITVTNVRIPRAYMLMKHTKVSRQGEVKEPPLQQLTYGALLQGRTAMVVDSGNVAKKALTIAIRYAAVRRQFSSSNSANGLETKLLDYPIHQRRLMPLLAQAFAMHFTGMEMQKMYDQMMERLDSASPGDADMEEVLEALKETHGTSAGLKAFCTWNCLNTIEQCRQACGGHGYSAYTGLAGMYNDFAVQCTWEGDNTILTLQSGRYLISCYREACAIRDNAKKSGKPGKKMAPGVGYLNHMDELLGAKCNGRPVHDLAVIAEAWDSVSTFFVKRAGEAVDECLRNGQDLDVALEECSQHRLYASKIHSFGYLTHRFIDGVNTAKSSPDSTPAIQNILLQLAQLYGLYTIEENAGAFLQCGYFSPSEMDQVRTNVTRLCKTVRDQAIPLVDAFAYSDYIINSPLGRADGNVYEHYYAQIKRANPPQEHPYFHKLIKPLLEREVLDNDDEEAGLEDEDEDEDEE
ncbi:hypothetical protein BZG36_03642 [Bifiguratus adelaidae]|uniref:Acyl-coenzyme A oxidase n=1 Tax=Bifiguratus adelaidae TaxID=1938954 RepID=A0A261XW79_9FUNG|nr:hypothetical protein BZG36_03642 [Bifiguratus adelaidae]